MNILFKAVRRLAVHENDIKRDPQNRWDIKKTCHLTRLENLESVNLYSEWPAYTISNPVKHISPVLFWVHEPHVIAGHCLYLEGSLRWPDWHPTESAFLPVADSEATLFPIQIRSGGRYFQAAEGATGDMWRNLETENLPKSIMKNRNDIPELMLVEQAKRAKLDRAGASLFAKLSMLDLCADLRMDGNEGGAAPEDLGALLSLCSNLQAIGATVIPRTARHFESWLLNHAARLKKVTFVDADLAWLPHLTACRKVRFDLNFSESTSPEQLCDNLRYAANKSRRRLEQGNATNRIVRLEVRLRGHFCYPFDPVELAEFLWTCASIDTVLVFRARFKERWHCLEDDLVTDSDYQQDVEDHFAALQRSASSL